MDPNLIFNYFRCHNYAIYTWHNAIYILHLVVENIRLKIARIEKGLSQQQLADEIGVTRQTIGLIEKGQYNPTLNLCVKLAKVLNKTLNDLFWEDKNAD